jgi:hypothetical protein
VAHLDGSPHGNEVNEGPFRIGEGRMRVQFFGDHAMEFAGFDLRCVAFRCRKKVG